MKSASSHIVQSSRRPLPGFLRWPVRWLLLIFLLVAAVGARQASIWIAQSPIDVGLDLVDGKVDGPLPELAWGDPDKGTENRVAMVPIPGRFSPKQASFKLTALGTKNPNSRSTEVWILNSEIAMDQPVSMTPETSWRLKNKAWGSFIKSRQPATFVWQGALAGNTLHLRTHDWSGLARLEFDGKSQELDLYSPQMGQKQIKITDGTLSRFHGQIPRAALAGLRIKRPQGGNKGIARLYIGTLIPTIYFAKSRYPVDAKGFIKEQFRPAILKEHVVVPSISKLEQGGNLTRVFLVAVFFVLQCLVLLGLWIVLYLIYWFVTQTPVQRTLAPARLSSFMIFFLPPWLLWMFYLGCNYPATMTPDSIDQWVQAHTMNISNSHPALHTLFIRLFTVEWGKLMAWILDLPKGPNIFDNPYTPVAIQLTLFAFALAYICHLVWRAGVPFIFPFLAMLGSALSVRNSVMAVYMIKDTPYTALVYILTGMLFHYIVDKSIARSWLYWIGLGIVVALLPNVRHNGLIIFAGVLPILPLVFFRSRYRCLLAITVACLVHFGTHEAVFKIVKANEGVLNEFCTFELFHLTAQEVPLPEEELVFLDKAAGFYRNVQPYSAYNHRDLGRSRDLKFIAENLKQYYALLFRTFQRYPLMLAYPRWARGTFTFWPPRGDYWIYTYNTGIMKTSRVPYQTEPLFPDAAKKVKKYLSKTGVKSKRWLYYRPGLAFWAIVTGFLLLFVRIYDWRLLIVFLPVFLNGLGLLLVTAGPAWRYHLPQTFCWGFFLCLPFLPKDPLKVRVPLWRRLWLWLVDWRARRRAARVVVVEPAPAGQPLLPSIPRSVPALGLWMRRFHRHVHDADVGVFLVDESISIPRRGRLGRKHMRRSAGRLRLGLSVLSVKDSALALGRHRRQIVRLAGRQPNQIRKALAPEGRN